VLVARQIYICLWVLFVWAREIDNLDAPYRASEWRYSMFGSWSNPSSAKRARKRLR